MSNEINTLLTYSSDAFLISDSSGQILYVNPAIEQVSGLEIRTHLGRNIRDLLEEKLINCSATFEALKEQETVTREVKTITGKHLLSTATPVTDSSGRLQRVVSNIRSLTVFPAEAVKGYGKIEHYEGEFEYGLPFQVIRLGEEEMIVSSAKMKSLVNMADHLGKVDSKVIIYGETGVGKELYARLIHESSSRARTGSFIKVNCAAFPPNLVESELFGYEPGAFTGALKNGKPGYFELADKGTLLLDEVSELPLDIQAKLLGILQDGAAYRVGGTKSRKINVRILAATNKNLDEKVERGEFREDLYYRLNVVPVELPPLRERIEDIPPFVSYLCEKFNNKYGFNKKISSDLLNTLCYYPWPGNVRELSNLIERLFVITPENVLDSSHLSKPYVDYSSPGFSFNINDEEFSTLKDMVEEFELSVVKKTVEKCETHAEAAKRLGISLSSLTRRLRKLKNRWLP